MYTSTFVLKQKLYFQSPYISEANVHFVQQRTPHCLVESGFFLFFKYRLPQLEDVFILNQLKGCLNVMS